MASGSRAAMVRANPVIRKAVLIALDIPLRMGAAILGSRSLRKLVSLRSRVLGMPRAVRNMGWFSDREMRQRG